MVDKEKLARLVALKKTLDDTENEINQLLAGGSVQAQTPTPEKPKSGKKCGACGEVGHRADGCPNRPKATEVTIEATEPTETTTELPQPQL
ncbi:hypothetical protein [Bradyrhizobium guangzhouense]|uniref:hypothetical protein n=1 Tax=Bradyrhizobium guangzhouense TaxID=1325095 RepID=UPI001008F825|nr:hypothetical protein [Bradyrhizobium guangzhouense]